MLSGEVIGKQKSIHEKFFYCKYNFSVSALRIWPNAFAACLRRFYNKVYYDGLVLH